MRKGRGASQSVRVLSRYRELRHPVRVVSSVAERGNLPVSASSTLVLPAITSRCSVVGDKDEIMPNTRYKIDFAFDLLICDFWRTIRNKKKKECGNDAEESYHGICYTLNEPAKFQNEYIHPNGYIT